MIHGTNQVVFADVEVIRDAGLVLMCRVANRIVGVPRRRMLPLTTIARFGDRGQLVLPREVALNLGLV